MGVNPDIIVLRCDSPLEESIFRKISLFCNVKKDCVFENMTLPNLYEVPLMLEKSGFSSVVCRELGIEAPEPDLDEWTKMAEQMKCKFRSVEIGLVGKYVSLHDAYLSVAEALRHAGCCYNACVNIHWIDSETLTEETYEEKLKDIDGIIVPGGFGSRGVEGMILAARYAREHGLPYFGICLGMQVAVIEFARHAAGIADANSSEAGSGVCPQGDRLHARTERGYRHGRHAAAGRLSLRDQGGDCDGALLRRQIHQRAGTDTAMSLTMITERLSHRRV